MTKSIKVSIPEQTTAFVQKALVDHAVSAYDLYWDQRRVFVTVASVPDLSRFCAVRALKNKRIEFSPSIYFYKFRNRGYDDTAVLFSLYFDIQEVSRLRIQDYLVILDSVAFVVFADDQIYEMLQLHSALNELNTERGDLEHGFHVQDGQRLLEELQRIPADGYERYACEKQINAVIHHDPHAKKQSRNEFQFNEADFELEDPPYEEQEARPTNLAPTGSSTGRYSQADIEDDIKKMNEAIDIDLDRLEFEDFLVGACRKAKAAPSVGDEFGKIEGSGWF